jgi:hypothetical protein
VHLSIARCPILIASFLLILATECLAQQDLVAAQQMEAANPDREGEDATTSAVWVAGATRAPVSDEHAWPDDRVLMLVGIERRFKLFEGALASITTAPAILPAVYTTGNRRKELQPCGVFEVCEVGVRYSSFGVGLIPLSIRVESSRAGRLRLVGYLDGGGVLSTTRIPAEWGTHFNFLAQIGADIRFSLGNGLWIEPGFRHLHISNGGTGALNPGLDTSLLVLGMAWR